MLFKQHHADMEEIFIKSVLKSEINGCVKVRIIIELVATSNCLLKITTAHVCESIRFYARRCLVHRLRLLSRNLLLIARHCMMPWVTIWNVQSQNFNSTFCNISIWHSPSVCPAIKRGWQCSISHKWPFRPKSSIRVLRYHRRIADKSIARMMQALEWMPMRSCIRMLNLLAFTFDRHMALLVVMHKLAYRSSLQIQWKAKNVVRLQHPPMITLPAKDWTVLVSLHWVSLHC
jgi:hypothetical protein